jgi:hypothetical protein
MEELFKELLQDLPSENSSAVNPKSLIISIIKTIDVEDETKTSYEISDFKIDPIKIMPVMMSNMMKIKSFNNLLQNNEMKTVFNTLGNLFIDEILPVESSSNLDEEMLSCLGKE